MARINLNYIIVMTSNFFLHKQNLLNHFKQLFAFLLLLAPVLVQAQSDSLVNGADQRISDTRDNHQNLTGKELAAASFPGSIAIPNTKTRVGFGGYVKLDWIQDLSGTLDKYEFLLGAIPVKGDGRPQKDAYMNLTERESRFYFDVRSITESGTPLRVYAEFDFWIKENGPFRLYPRMRHLYAVYGNLTVGRTWGTLTDPLSWPVSIDFGADGLNGARRPLIRWEQPGAHKNKFAISLEMDESPGIANPLQTAGEASPVLPILSTRIKHQFGGKGHIMVGAQIRQLRWDGESANSKAFGWGAALTGRGYTNKRDFITWNMSFGDAWADNTSTAIGNEESAVLTAGGKLRTLNAGNAAVGYSHYFSPTLASSINASGVIIENTALLDGNSYQKGFVSHINLIWSPWKHVNTGIEYMYGTRVNLNSLSGNGSRVQAMVKYIF